MPPSVQSPIASHRLIKQIALGDHGTEVSFLEAKNTLELGNRFLEAHGLTPDVSQSESSTRELHV